MDGSTGTNPLCDEGRVDVVVSGGVIDVVFGVDDGVTTRGFVE